MLVNGQRPAKSGSSYSYSNIAPVQASSLASGAVMTVSGRPGDLSFTPTLEDCQAGRTISLSTSATPLTKQELEYEVLYVNRENNQTVGKYIGSDGTGYHASQKYGTSTINTNTALLRDYVTKNLKGYRMYNGVPGSPDRQDITLTTGKDGVSPKSVTMYVEVNHGTLSDLHTQKVQFTHNGNVIFETTVPLKSTYLTNPTIIELNMSGISEQLQKLGYTFDDTKKYTISCNNYTHNPDVTTIEADTWFPYEYKIDEDSVVIIRYLGYDTTVIIPDKIEEKPVTGLGEKSFADRPSLVSVDIPKNIVFIADNAFENSPNVVLHGYPETAALTFANEHNLTFVCKEHHFSEWKTSKEPLCTTQGEEIRSCKCGETEYRTLDALTHSFGEWNIIKESTSQEAGIKERICSMCGEKETEHLPLLSKPDNTPDKDEDSSGSNDSVSDKDSDTIKRPETIKDVNPGKDSAAKKPSASEKKTVSVKTGDNAPAATLLLVLSLSFLTAFGIYIRQKRA